MTTTGQPDRTVGPLRYSILDALLPMLTALVGCALAGLSVHALAWAGGGGLAVAAWRMLPYIGEAATSRRRRRAVQKPRASR